MSTSVIGIRAIDGRFSQMIAIKESCDDAGIGYPAELVEYFGDHDAAESSAYLREEMETIDIGQVLTEFTSSGRCHYQVDLSKLSDEVKAIRFTNSW